MEADALSMKEKCDEMQVSYYYWVSCGDSNNSNSK